MGLVALFSTGAGLMYGAWVDGVDPVWIAVLGWPSSWLAGGTARLARQRRTAPA